MTSAGSYSSKRPRGPLLKTLSIFFIAGLFTGSTVGPDYKRPEVPVPASWRTVDEASGSITNFKWWQLFEDQTLQKLIRTALNNNNDLQLAVARVAEARVLFGEQHVGKKEPRRKQWHQECTEIAGYSWLQRNVANGLAFANSLAGGRIAEVFFRSAYIFRQYQLHCSIFSTSSTWHLLTA